MTARWHRSRRLGPVATPARAVARPELLEGAALAGLEVLGALLAHAERVPEAHLAGLPQDDAELVSAGLSDLHEHHMRLARGLGELYAQPDRADPRGLRQKAWRRVRSRMVPGRERAVATLANVLPRVPGSLVGVAGQVLLHGLALDDHRPGGLPGVPAPRGPAVDPLPGLLEWLIDGVVVPGALTHALPLQSPPLADLPPLAEAMGALMASDGAVLRFLGAGVHADLQARAGVAAQAGPSRTRSPALDAHRSILAPVGARTLVATVSGVGGVTGWPVDTLLEDLWMAAGPHRAARLAPLIASLGHADSRGLVPPPAGTPVRRGQRVVDHAIGRLLLRLPRPPAPTAAADALRALDSDWPADWPAHLRPARVWALDG
jgi:hypothetical protein